MKVKITGKYNKKVLAELSKLYKEKNGLTAKDLFERAKDKNNPLHNLFEWNKDITFTKWNIHQARMIINDIKVTLNNKDVYLYETVKVTSNIENESERVYKTIMDISKNPELRIQVIKNALEQIIYWKAKYSSYKEFKPIVIAIEKLETRLNKK